MGLNTSPGYAQAQMEEVLRGIGDNKCYIDDIGIFSTSWDCHLATVDEVLRWRGKWIHHKSSQVQMSRQGNRLARLLANSYWVETLLEKGRGNSEDEASHERDWTSYVPRDGNVLSWHVAKAFAYLGPIHKIGWSDEGGKNWLDAWIK